jgi:hypothetical protein
MTKLKEVDSKSESESDRRQQTQKAKILAKIAEKVFNDVVESVQKGNSESLWEVGLQAFEQANELSLIQKAGPIETLPIGEAARFDIVNGFGLQEQGEESLELQPWPPCPLPTVELPDSARKSFPNPRDFSKRLDAFIRLELITDRENDRNHQ